MYLYLFEGCMKTKLDYHYEKLRFYSSLITSKKRIFPGVFFDADFWCIIKYPKNRKKKT